MTFRCLPQRPTGIRDQNASLAAGTPVRNYARELGELLVSLDQSCPEDFQLHPGADPGPGRSSRIVGSPVSWQRAVQNVIVRATSWDLAETFSMMISSRWRHDPPSSPVFLPEHVSLLVLVSTAVILLLPIDRSPVKWRVAGEFSIMFINQGNWTVPLGSGCTALTVKAPSL
jgi:hypothetical protein